ncbi:hypothetical protein WOSG25_070200 [Weissella oryzae SG25]|uniref:Uncharacterized protein n=1 Tax=Weissella oryzae (strain DSM 25784 / JCM 18191 / LMG 30913 / SG25) TaxID=1329250 RepID=A0A069CUX7_WEIOS|nr:hypothetical protein [Weissella oryzae]GAK31043.1 hypothetical protein WOSG25_070200 [Weissella oryzae SG25]
MGLDMWLMSGNDKKAKELMYWRKANQIRNWIVTQANADKDTNVTCELSKVELNALLIDIKSVLDDNSMASRLLPTQNGFFFGSTDYDNYYFAELADTLKNLKPIVTNMAEDDKLTYTEWW